MSTVSSGSVQVTSAQPEARQVARSHCNLNLPRGSCDMCNCNLGAQRCATRWPRWPIDMTLRALPGIEES